MFAILGRLDLHFQLFLIALVHLAIDDTITKVHQRIEAETESCDDALLLSSMYCESIFFWIYLATVKISERNDQSASFFVDNGQCDAQAIGADWYALALEFKVPERKKEGEKRE